MLLPPTSLTIAPFVYAVPVAHVDEVPLPTFTAMLAPFSKTRFEIVTVDGAEIINTGLPFKVDN